MNRKRVHAAFIGLQLAYQLRAESGDAASCELVNEAEHEWREAQRQELDALVKRNEDNKQ
jgi:hypothetical protein